ncbi:MAG: nucleotide exchange factor GrpE [Spirochaetota bacterium]
MSSKHHEHIEPQADAATEAQAASETAPAEAEAEVQAHAVENASLREHGRDLEAQIAKLVEESSALKDQYLRSLADSENFRKRMFREREDMQKYANYGILTDIVPIMDDFDRAIASAEHARDYQTLHDGIAIIRRQLGSILENKYGLTRYDTLEKPFDPHIHEAVASEPGDVDEAIVSLEFLPGYKLHERVVRSAKVRVKMPVQSSEAPRQEINSVSEDTAKATV